MAIFGASSNFSDRPARCAHQLPLAAARSGPENTRHDVGGFVSNVGITFELEELIPGSESRVALGYADGYSRPQPAPLYVAAWQIRARSNV